MSAPLASIVKGVLSYGGKQTAISAATDKETRKGLIVIIASIGCSLVLFPFILIMVIVITISSAMSTFFDDVKNFLSFKWVFSAFEDDNKSEIEEEIEAWFQSLSQAEKNTLGLRSISMRDWLISKGKVNPIDDGDALFIGGHIHRRLTNEQIEIIIQGIHNEDMKILIRWAAERVGMPYSQALRDSGTHFDCSSFIFYAYRQIGVNISHGGSNTAAEIAKGLEIRGKRLSGLDELKPGDLIFSKRSGENNGRYKNISHVVLYVGNGMVIDAQSTNTGVTYRKLPNYNQSTLVFAARP
ncbi:MAG: C40 family peptidase [Lachnospiraceae bacterium]|nr:C40 family peptidase [Lachnospiraceae bacterium]